MNRSSFQLDISTDLGELINWYWPVVDGFEIVDRGVGNVSISYQNLVNGEIVEFDAFPLMHGGFGMFFSGDQGSIFKNSDDVVSILSGLMEGCINAL